MHTFPWAVAVGGRSFLGISKEDADAEFSIREYVKLQVEFLVSVHPSVCKKNDRQGAGMTRAERYPGTMKTSRRY